MKREVCCSSCTDAWRQSAGIHHGDAALDAVMRSRERLNIVTGTARVSCRCDGCNKPLEPGDPCSAVSVYVPAEGDDYFAWEEAFVQAHGHDLLPLRSGR